MTKKRYIPVKKLTEERIEKLLELHDTVKPQLAVSHRRRNGVNIEKNLSVYTYQRWFNWNRHQRGFFRSCFPPELAGKAITGYFIGFPAEEGHLDLMLTWVDRIGSGTMIAYALHDNQHVWLDGRKVTVNKGEGIAFSLKVPHQVKHSTEEALWANIMVSDHIGRELLGDNY